MLKERIQEGVDGKYKGLKNGFERINNYIFGIQRSCYYLIGGQSGTFKTTLVDYILFNAIEDAKAKGIELNVFYYSYEIDKLNKQCNWLSNSIFQKYNRVISPEKIKGLGEFRLDDEEKTIVESEIPFMEETFSNINFSFYATNPTGIYHDLFKFAETKGTLIKEPYINADGITKQKIISYTPHNPDAYNLVVIDHLYHLKKEREYGTKETIDKYSEYCVELRNLFGYSFINIQQFNDGLSSVERMKFKGVDMSPQQSDFKDTRNPYQDADVVMGTMCPYKLDMNKCLDYNIEKLGSKMIMLKIIKNRLSTDNIAIGLYVEPKSGTFSELPDPDVINYTNYMNNI